MPKIFGVGLPRTGTTSLHVALLMLGIPSIHRPIEMAAPLFFNSLAVEQLQHYDGYTDLPIPIYYRELHKLCPDALFVLTHRGEEAWLTSIENFFSSRSQSSPQTATRDMMRFALFGTVSFNRDRFRRVFRQHNSEVQEYFKSMPSSLLCLDVSEDRAWRSLTDFIGLEGEKNREFPKISSPRIGWLSSANRSNVSFAQKHLRSLLG
jgi:hypothetical protein